MSDWSVSVMCIYLFICIYLFYVTSLFVYATGLHKDILQSVNAATCHCCCQVLPLL